MAAVWMRIRSEARSRWRAWLSLALIFGIGAGAATAAIAGARRTDTAYPRFVEAQDGFDAFTGGGGERNFVQRFETLKRHPMVERFVELIVIAGDVTVPAKPGRPETVLAFPELLFVADPTGRALYETNRAKVLEGRLADRTVPDETMIPFVIAERYGIEVGDRIVVGFGFDPEDFSPLERAPLRVVGIYAAPGDFEAVGQSSFATMPATPAAYEKYRHLLPEPTPDLWNLALHLRGGADAAPQFKRIIGRDFSIDVPIIEPVIRSGVQKTIRLYAFALWLLGALIAVATVAIVGQTLARQQMLESAEYPALRAMGMSQRQLLGLGLLRSGLIGLVAAALAGLAAFLLSPLTPIGPARIAEPSPGLSFDATAVGLGAAAVLIVVPLITLIPSLRAARSAGRAEDLRASGAARPSRIVQTMTRLSRSPATATGLRMALEPGRGSTSVPVRSTILAVALGVAAVASSAVVGESLTHLLETPALTGFTYDAILPDEDEDPTNDADRQSKLRALPFVDRAVSGTLLNAVIGGDDVFLLGFDDGGDIGYAVIEGRAPKDAPEGAVPEIALGPATMRRLGVAVGSTVEFGYPDPNQSDEEEESEQPIARELLRQRARIVGVAAIPAFPFAVTEPGEGAIMSAGAIGRFNPLERGGCCFVGFKPETDLIAAREQLQAAGFEVLLRTTRTDLAILEKISRLPILLSAIFAAIAAAALAHVLVTAVRRRRRDLAILKTLGFVQRQVRGAIAWQVSAIAVLSVAMGIPAGIVLGRWGWRLIADQFGVVPVSVAPVPLLALVLPAGLVLANLVAAIPARIAARTQPALVLRTE